MKDFDLAAAKRGARVCTREGWPARILCFDSAGVGRNGSPMPIIAEIFTGRGYSAFSYRDTGRIDGDRETCYDLMMADDDYLEKLERGEYNHIEDNLEKVGKADHIGEPTEKVDWSEWRMRYAGRAMEAILIDDPNSKPDYISTKAVQVADALIEELKNEKK